MSNQITTTNGQSDAIVKGPQARMNTLKDLFESRKGAIAALLPKHLTAERLTGIVISAASRTPDLLLCTPQSILLAVMQSGALGLEPNTPLGLAYILPFNNKRTGKKEAQFIPGYRGLIRLAMNSGEIKAVQARVIYERDTYSIVYGTSSELVHSPYIAGDAGAMIGAYAVAELANGSKVFEFMSVSEIDAIRAQSMASGSGPWVSHYGEMAKKTVIRRLAKTLPLSEEKLARALEHQAIAEAGTGPDYSDVITVEEYDAETGEIIADDAPKTRTDALKAKLGKAGDQ